MRVEEIGDRIYRLSTPVTDMPGGFSFNQYLVVDDEALLFHTGPRALAPAVIEGIARVVPLPRLRWIGFGHVEADECGGLNAILAAPNARPVAGRIGAMVSVTDLADRPPHVLEDGAPVQVGGRTLVWLDAPHVPHGWDGGLMYEPATRTLLCGDLFTQPGTGDQALTEGDILGPSDAFRRQMDYWSYHPGTRAVLERLAGLEPTTLACMHGSAFRGRGDALLRALADTLDGPR